MLWSTTDCHLSLSRRQTLSVCLFGTPVTRTHRYITPFWSQDDPLIEHLPFSFGPEAHLAR